MATQRDVAEHLDLTDRQVRALVKKGVLPGSHGTGGLNVDACRAAYINYLRGLARNQIADTGASDSAAEYDLDLERVRNLRADTEIKELKAAQMRAELAPISVIESVLASMAAQVSAVLESIPQIVKSRAPQMSPSDIELIAHEIIRCQNVAAEMMANLDEYIDAGADSPDQNGDS